MKWFNDFTDDYIGILYKKAFETLEKYGIAIENPEALENIKSHGYKIKGNRFFVSKEEAEKKFYEINAVNDKHWGTVHYPQTCNYYGVGDMPQYYHNPHDDATLFLTVRTLADSTKFLYSLHKKNPSVWPMVPGVPRDIPANIQNLTEYIIGKLVFGGGNIDTMYPPESFKYLVEMGAVYGEKFEGASMFTVSPLKLSGHEFDSAYERRHTLKEFYIDSLPTIGASGPTYLGPLWTSAIAETLGAGIFFYEVSGGKPVRMNPGLFPFDVRKTWVAGGLPEHSLFEYQRYLVNKKYNPHAGYSHSASTSAKECGIQASAEKAAGIGFAKTLGCMNYCLFGCLAFDDIFSPSQFLLDLETAELANRYVKDTEEPESDRWLEIIGEGYLTDYLNNETTLENYRNVYYLPDLFERDMLTSVYPNRFYNIKKSVNKKAADIIKDYSYERDEDKAKEIIKIFNHAVNRLCNGYKIDIRKEIGI